jgi:L-threonylcarbamoyladenylate synthase
MYWSDENTVAQVKAALENDQLVVGTSDTVLGLLGNLTVRSFERLNALKGRQEKPYLIIIRSLEQVAYFADEYDHNVYALLAACWPGPLTVLLKAKASVPSYLVSRQGTIALRAPAHEGLQKLLHSFSGLFSTSANKAGMAVPKTMSELDPTIQAQVAYCIEDKGKASSAVPSTIIDCSVHNVVRVVRAGAYPVAHLEKIYGAPFEQS